MPPMNLNKDPLKNKAHRKNPKRSQKERPNHRICIIHGLYKKIVMIGKFPQRLQPFIKPKQFFQILILLKKKNRKGKKRH